jgi:hypothetical protein
MQFVTGIQVEHMVTFGVYFLWGLTLTASVALFWRAGVKDKRGRRS